MHSPPGPCGSSDAACCPDSYCTEGNDTGYTKGGRRKQRGEGERSTHKQGTAVHVDS